MNSQDSERENKIGKKQMTGRKRGRGEQITEETGDDRMDMGQSGAINLTDNRVYTISEKNDWINKVKD